MTKSSYIVQGVNVHLLCDNLLHSPTSSFFNSICRGKRRFEIKPLGFELHTVEEPLSLPANAIKVIKFPSITCYSNDKEIYFASMDGSIVHLNPIKRLATGFFKKEVLEDPLELSSLIGAPFVETLKYHGLYPIHSAALYGNGKGYLISGSSGCGKTTASLSMVQEGFKYASDDFVLFEEVNEEIIVHSFYKTFNVGQDLSDRFPALLRENNLPISQGSKVSLDISEIFPDSFISQLRPDVIMFPTITSKEKSQLVPISQTEVYTRILKQTVLAVDKEVSRNQLKALAKLVKQNVGFELLSGKDIYNDSKNLSILLEDRLNTPYNQLRR